MWFALPCLSAIVLLNLLVALMSKSYDFVHSKGKAMARFSRSRYGVAQRHLPPQFAMRGPPLCAAAGVGC